MGFVPVSDAESEIVAFGSSFTGGLGCEWEWEGCVEVRFEVEGLEEDAGAEVDIEDSFFQETGGKEFTFVVKMEEFASVGDEELERNIDDCTYHN